MSPALVRTTGVVVPMATEGVVAMAVAVVTVVVGVAGRVVAGSEDIRQGGDLNSNWHLHRPLLTHPSQIEAA